MSTEQKEQITSLHPTVTQIVAEMCDGRAFGRATPRSWGDALKVQMPAVIAALANRRASLADVSDLQIGQAFDEEIGNRVSPGLYSHYSNERELSAFGAYLRQQAALFEGRPEGIPPFPERPSNPAVGHTPTYDLIKAWADDGVADLEDSVDEQARYLRVLGDTTDRSANLWPACCTSNGESKEFLGRAMDYKRARLALGSESEVEPEPSALGRLNDTVVALQEQVATLEATVSSLRQQVEDAQSNHRNDIDIISRGLNEEARRRDWCSEYEEWGQRVNRRLSIPLDIEPGEEEVEGNVDGYIRVPFSVGVSATVNSRADSSEREEALMESFNENYTVRDLLRNYADSDQAEIEEDPSVELA